jgi:glycogen synthase
LYALRMAVCARRFKATVAVIDSGTSHYFALTFFRLLGIPVFVNLHNVLWPRGFPPQNKLQRIVRYLNSLFFQYICAGGIGVSPECERQIKLESRGRMPFFQYRCQFTTTGFSTSGLRRNDVFRIAFVGRAESNKGVLDIPQMARALRNRTPIKVVFEICGDGPALRELKSVVRDQRMQDEVIVHGRLERSALLDVYGRCNAVIVPTRSNFTEGMPQVCAESVLSGIPVITSEVANAFDVIGPATVHAVTDDIESYVSAITSLIKDKSLYDRLQSECPKQSLQFLDRSQSYPAALDRLLETVTGQKRILAYSDIFRELCITLQARDRTSDRTS